jgi:hypothetical protein
LYYLLEITSDKEPENTSRKPPVIWNMLKDDTFSLHPIRDIETENIDHSERERAFVSIF